MIAAWTVALALAASAAGFDHVIHEGRVVGSIAEPPACTDCHALRGSGALAGAPGHGACFGACHGEPPQRARKRKPYALDARRRRLCASCHASDALDQLAKGELTRPGVAFPPYTIDPDYTLAMPHAKHADTACGDCHATGGAVERARPPHDRCARCHARPTAAATPTMTNCATCHRPAFGPAVGPTLARGALPVTALFDHARHAARQPDGAAAECSACHAAIADTDGESLPAPTMAMCATCHDGQRAFATTATRCRACHQPMPSTRPDHRRRVPFSHARHAALDASASRECAGCHAVEADGRIAPPGQEHRPCADSACHADEFAARQPTLCGACHVGNEPWRALRWFPLPARASEFRVSFSHAAHGAAEDARCIDCHAGDGARRTVTGGHRSCAGAGCHRPDEGAAPLRACASCHSDATSAAASGGSRWSVRARFRHDLHTSACTDCHRARAAEVGGDELARPAKQDCATCHDGARAFKMTGHACSRCHAK